jgi:hypothetical protein
MGRKVLITASAVLLAVVILSACFTVYYTRAGAGAYILWNADSTFIFAGVTQYEYHFRSTYYPVEAIREIFPLGASSPNDKHYSVVIVRIFPDGIQHYSLNNFYLGIPDTFAGNIYVRDLLSERLMRWTGTQFVPVSSKEEQDFQNGSNAGKVPSTPNYTNADGWSRHTIGGNIIQRSTTDYNEKDTSLIIRSQGDTLKFIMNDGFINGELYVDLVRSGGEPQRILYIDQRPHRISRAAYEGILGN